VRKRSDRQDSHNQHKPDRHLRRREACLRFGDGDIREYEAGTQPDSANRLACRLSVDGPEYPEEPKQPFSRAADVAAAPDARLALQMVELVRVLHDCQAAISPSSKMIGLLLSAALVTGRRCARSNVQRATCTWHYHIPHASLRVRSSPPSVFYFGTMLGWKRHAKNIQNTTWCNIQHRRFLGAGTRCSVPRPCLSATCHCIYATATSTRCTAKPRRAYPQRAMRTQHLLIRLKANTQ
jgi:hypothetical protein